MNTTRSTVITLRPAATACLAAVVLTLLPTTGPAAGLLKPVGGRDGGATIKSHHVEVVLNNGFAQTTVDQVFGNTSAADFDACYSFPVPKAASLSELSLWIDGKEVLGEVVEKKKAREIYEKQVQQGQQTALAEKNDFKTFDIHIGRVKAGQDTRVRLVYYQPLEIDLNVGRYVYPLAEGGVDDQRIAFWETDARVRESFSFRLKLKSAFPVKEVRMPGYDQTAAITRSGETGGTSVFDAVLENKEGSATLDRDIVFYYRLDDTVPARVELIPYRASPQALGTFMAIVTPAADLQRIAEGADWIFVLDRSGSMSGPKIKTLADGVGKVLGKLSAQDRFKIVTFNDRASDETGGFVTATPEHVQTWIEKVRGLQAEGSTALFAGLNEAYSHLDDDRTSSVILVTDGVCNVGPTDHAAFLKLLKTHDLRLFTFVMGNSANQPLMERLAKDSGGFAMNISDSDDIVGRLLQAKAHVLHECLHDVRLTFGGETVREVTPSKLGNLYIGQQLVVFGRYSGHGPVELKLSAKISGQPREWHCAATLPETDTDNPELERLWALASIDECMEKIREEGETETLRKQVADLGTAFSLVTDYTSMVVLNDTALEGAGLQRTNLQRVQTERAAQQQRTAAPVKNYSADSGTTFQNRSSPGIGTGPVGPFFLLFAGGLLYLRKHTKRNA
jgi:Ca-activated chloride channel family protein